MDFFYLTDSSGNVSSIQMTLDTNFVKAENKNYYESVAKQKDLGEN
jgi:hypothetical protein